MRQSTHIRFPDKEPGSHLQDVASEHSPLAKCIAALIAISVLIIAPGTSNANSVREQAVHSHLILQGDVKDERGDAIGGAKVTLSSGNRRLEVLTDERGHFVFKELEEGAYSVLVESGGFASYQEDISVGPEPRSGQVRMAAITLHPTIKETIKVDASGQGVSLDPETGAGTQVLKEKNLEALPDDPDELATQLQQMATSSGSAPGQATVTVDGFLNDGRLPPKSAIREVRVNPDLYSAEYDTPPYQGGRIEIFTKPGAPPFHGSGFFNFNDSALNAREAFAPTKPSESTKRYGFQFGGPITLNRSGFLVDFEARDINQPAIVDALVLNAQLQPVPLAASVAAPKLLLIGSARFDWQVTQSNVVAVRYDFNGDRLDNLGVGAFSLRDNGFNSITSSHAIRLSDIAAFGARISNEARLGVTLEEVNQQPASSSTEILVPGAFISGGAASQILDHREYHIEFNDYLSLTSGKHSLKMGTQLLDRDIHDRSLAGFNGAFIFGGGIAPELDSAGNAVTGPGGPVLVSISGLEQYRRALVGQPGGTPTKFTLTSGNPSAGVNQLYATLFIQDQWRFRPDLLVSAGLRYEAQNEPAFSAGFAPRLGLAYSPDKAQKWVIRARAGIFFNRIDQMLHIQAERLNGMQEQQILINSPSFPDPFASGSANQAIPTIRRLASDLRPSRSLQLQIGFEHQLPHGWRIQMNENWARGWASMLSRNINAPILVSGSGPSTILRPLGIDENLLEFESAGSLKGNVIFVGAQQTSSKLFNLFCGYLYFNFHTNTDGATFLPQNSYNLAAEWARPSWQAAHRAFVVVNFNLPKKIRLSSLLNAASGLPFDVTTGQDNNGDGNFTDRPSFASPGSPASIGTPLGVFDPAAINGNVPRNFGTNPATVDLSMNVSRTFRLAKRSRSGDSTYDLTVNCRASNVLNHPNFTGLSGVVTSPFFAQPNNAGSPRRLEVGMRFSF